MTRDALWRDHRGFRGHQTHIWLLPKGRRGWAWTGEQGCSENTVCFMQLCPAHWTLGMAQGSLLPQPISGAKLAWTRPLGHQDVPLGKGMCSQGNHWECCIIPSFETFDARGWMIHLCVITATSFWSHDRHCHRPVVGFHWGRKLICKQDTDQALASLEH